MEEEHVMPGGVRHPAAVQVEGARQVWEEQAAGAVHTFP
jgi:hypothetical protein